MSALGETTYCTDMHFSMSDEEMKRMRAAVKKLGPKRNMKTASGKDRSFGTYYTKRWGDPHEIREWYWWHHKEVEHVLRLGVIERGR